ncbi:MAG TPA: sodium:proton antiporter [Longimicrobiales bacterium]|nr:sodium:proton antiporter [Longimicrobiales bacterium]
MPNGPAISFAIALAAGVLAQSIGARLRVPGIVLLLLTGVLVGPDVLGVVQPRGLGSGLEIIVGMSVAVILFEGGLNLQLDRLRGEALTIRRLITLGAMVTAVGGTVAARVFMGWDWSIALLFGTLVIVTGPTVITPLLRRVRVNRNVKTILEAEGVLIDPIGAIAAVVVFELVVTPATGASAALTLLGLPGRLVFGGVAGLIGGVIIGVTLRRGLVPDNLINVFTLSMVIALYELCETVLPESGIMAAPIAGMIVGNMHHRLKRELNEFKEQLTVMLVGLLFVLLAADVRVAEVLALGWGGVLTVLALMFIVRPAVVALSTTGSLLTLREKAFIGWLGPRGIVAAAVASLFAERLSEPDPAQGLEFRALVFLVIAATVIVQGGLSPLVSRLLGVRQPENNGWVIIGANPLARLLAKVLTRDGQDVLMIDTSAYEVEKAEREGLRAMTGNAGDERTLLRADIESRRGVIALTPNEGVNLLLAGRASDIFSEGESLVALNRDGNVAREQVEERGTRVLFGQPIELQQWLHRLSRQPFRVELWRLAAEAGAEVGRAGDRGVAGEPGGFAIPLAVERNGAVRPVADDTRFQPDDLLYLVRVEGAEDATITQMEREGWTLEREVAEVQPGAERRSGHAAGLSGSVAE